MKTSTAIILAAAGVGVVYLITRPNPKPATSGGLQPPFSLGGLIDGASSLIKRFAGNTGNLSPQQAREDNYVSVTDYDAQGTADQPVYGIAGLDY